VSTLASNAARRGVRAEAALDAPVACAHCSLRVPAGLIEPGADKQFCCAGCRSVYEIIHSSGLERFYHLREATADPARVAPARAGEGSYEAFDDEVFLELHARDAGGGLKRVELYLEGVHCAACVWLIERLGRVAPGVVDVRLDLGRALVSVTWDPGQGRFSEAALALARLGYPPHPARDADARAPRRQEDRRWMIRLGVAGACAGNVMLISFALYGGMFEAMDAAHETLFRWSSAGLAAISLAWPGRVFFRGAIASLRTGAAHLDAPIALALGVGAISGLVNTIRGAGEIYFDSLTALVFLLLIGRWLQQRQQRRAADSVGLLHALTPASARLIEGEGDAERVRDVPIDALRAGSIVEVDAGDSIPADGVIVRGSTTLDRSLLTGESRPGAAGEGDWVEAGVVNIASVVRVRVEAAGEETRVAGLMRLVEESARRRAPIVRATDRIAGWFVIVVSALGAATLGIWSVIEPSRAVGHAVALLIVSCPCALGLATPLTVAVAIGRAARRGLLIKGGDALERLTRPGLILLDKTGTITEGRPRVVEWIGDESAIPAAGAIESGVRHPVAQAITAHAGERASRAGASVEQTLGGGVAGEAGGRRLLIGSGPFVRAAGVETDAWAERVERDLATRGLTPVLIAESGRMIALAGVGDPVRDDARASIEALRDEGWEVGVLSGDDPEVVRRVGREIGIDERACRGGVSPEGKAGSVEEAAARGPVVMVGDGVNDAPALALATVGVSVHGGAEASLAAADVAVRRPGLAPVVELARGSRRTLRAVRRALLFSLGYNGLGATLAMSGLINPLLAAVLMPVSSITVITLACRARTFEG